MEEILKRLIPDTAPPSVRRLVRLAVRRVLAMDKIDGRSEAELPLPVSLRTVAMALAAGVQTQAWDCAADALVMLAQILNNLGTGVVS